jgi:hypothetical protein
MQNLIISCEWCKSNKKTKQCYACGKEVLVCLKTNKTKYWSCDNYYPTQKYNFNDINYNIIYCSIKCKEFMIDKFEWAKNIEVRSENCDELIRLLRSKTTEDEYF